MRRLEVDGWKSTMVGLVDSVQQAEGSNIGWRTASRTFLPHEFPFLEGGVYNSGDTREREIGLFGTRGKSMLSRTTLLVRDEGEE